MPMLRRRSLIAATIAACALLAAMPARADVLLPGAACGGALGTGNFNSNNGILTCNGSTYVANPTFIGTASRAPYTCSGTTYLGMIYYDTTAGALENCTSSGWSIVGTTTSSISGSGTTSYVARWTSGTALGTGILYDNGTQVGIGTTSPNFTFDLASSTANTGIMVEGYASNPNPSLVFRAAEGSLAAPSAVLSADALGGIGARGYGTTGFSASSKVKIGFNAAQNWTDAAQGTYMTFNTTAIGTASSVEAMRIDSTGYVGVGTTTPAAPLEVWTSRSGGPSLTSSANTTAEFASSITTALDIGNDSMWPYEVWLQTKRYNNDGSNWPLSFNPLGGNVGIGTSSPADTLDVYGTGIHISSGTPTSTSMALYNNAGTLTWNGMALAISGSLFSGLTSGDFCTASSGTSIQCATASTGTGSVVLSASPALTGTITAAAENLSGALTIANEYVIVNGGGEYVGLDAPVPSTNTTAGTSYPSGFYATQLYNNTGYPAPYGYLMSMGNAGNANSKAQMFFGWTGYGDQNSAAGEPAYFWVRTNRDASNQFGTWQQGVLLQQNGDLNLGGAGYDYYGSGNLHVSGSVGIGTTGPTQTLSVGGNIALGNAYSGLPQMIIQNTGWTQKGYVGVTYQGDTIEFGANGAAASATTANLANTSVGTFIATASPSYFEVQYAASGTNPVTLSTPFYINNSGYVGIGTTSPGYPLDVNGNIRIQNFIYSASGDIYIAPADQNVTLYNGSNSYVLNIYNGSTDEVHLAASGNSYLNGGNVGIGTVNPTQPLSVNGNVDVMGSAVLMEITNTSAAVNHLAKLNTSGAAIIPLTTDTDGMVGVVIGTTAGSAQIAIGGTASCAFDGATTAGDFVTVSSSVAGDCKDYGTSRPGGQSIGRVLSTDASSGTYNVALGLSAPGGGVPNGTIAAFATTTCPSGWTVFTASTGVFLRGYDPTNTYDPSGSTRTVGTTIEADMVGPHTHGINPYILIGDQASTGAGNGFAPSGDYAEVGLLSEVGAQNTYSNGTAETRPKNVAVLYCKYTGGSPIIGATATGGATNYVARWTSGTVIGTGIIYDNGSAVGIGTTSPSAVLTANATTSYGTDTTYALELMDGANSLKRLALGYDNTINAGVISSAYNGGVWQNTVINPNGGNVGIGTTNPSYPLTVVSANTTTTINGVNSSTGYGVAGSSAGTYGVVGATSAGGSIYCGGFFSSGSYNACLGRADGYSFVGTGAVWATGNDYFNQSDGRLKENVIPLTGNLSIIERLRPVSYTWRPGSVAYNSNGKKRQLGLIAQEVQKVVPEVVTMNPHPPIPPAGRPDGKKYLDEQLADGTYGIAYVKLVPVLIGAVQELKADNDNLRAELEKANTANDTEATQIKALTVRLDALEAAHH